MSDYASRRISEAELSVMETLWDNGSPMTAKDLQVLLKERRGWGHRPLPADPSAGEGFCSGGQGCRRGHLRSQLHPGGVRLGSGRGAGGPALRQRRPDPGHHFDSAWDAEKGRFGRTVIK